jgi:Flp pilus assembly protein TadD
VAWVAIVAVSLYHTLPWIALNHSLDRSIARFETLPLGLGRVESTLGYWYTLRGDDVTAERWYVRSLDQNAVNIRAHLGLASIYRARGDAVGELLALRETVRLRPLDERARWRLLDALVRAHAWDAAVEEAARLAAAHPGDASISIAHAVTLALAGREPDADREMARAARITPGDLGLERRIAEIRAASRDTAALGALWAREFGVPEPHVP